MSKRLNSTSTSCSKSPKRQQKGQTSLFRKAILCRLVNATVQLHYHCHVWKPYSGKKKKQLPYYVTDRHTQMCVLRDRSLVIPRNMHGVVTTCAATRRLKMIVQCHQDNKEDCVDHYDHPERCLLLINDCGLCGQILNVAHDAMQ